MQGTSGIICPHYPGLNWDKHSLCAETSFSLHIESIVRGQHLTETLSEPSKRINMHKLALILGDLRGGDVQET